MPARCSDHGGDGDGPLLSPNARMTRQSAAAAANEAAAPPSYTYMHRSQQPSHPSHAHGQGKQSQSHPRQARPYVPPYDERRCDTTGPRLLYNGQQINVHASSAGSSNRDTSTMGDGSRLQHSGRNTSSSSRYEGVGNGNRQIDVPPDHTADFRTAPIHASWGSPMLPGDTPFGIRTPRGIPRANGAGNGKESARWSSSQSPAGNNGTSGIGCEGRFSALVPPPSNAFTTGTQPGFGDVQTRLASPPTGNGTRKSNGNTFGVEAIYQAGGTFGGSNSTGITMGPGSPPRSPSNQTMLTSKTPASPPRSPSGTVVSSIPRSPSVSPRALPAMAVGLSTRNNSFGSQGRSPPSSPVSTSRARSPSAVTSSYTRPSFSGQTHTTNNNGDEKYDSNAEGMATTGYVSSYFSDYESNMDDSRTYETGTVGSGTYQSSTIAMNRSHSYTATLDEETATYQSGTIASQTIQTAQTDDSGTFGKSFDSTYQTSRETYDTGEDTEVEESRGQQSNGGKKKSTSRFVTNFNRWKQGRQRNTDDRSTSRSAYDTDGRQGKAFDYTAFREGKQASKSGGSSGPATSPQLSKEILPTSPSGVSLGTADIDAQVIRKEKIDYENTQQQHGYLAILLTLIQTLILAAMMAFCGAAPLKINWSIGPYPDALSEFGAKNPYLMVEMNQWWRFFTPQMLNTGVIQLLCNAYVQLETAAFYEREWGSRRWCIIYFCSAVGSTIVSSILDPDTIGVSSSSALMGIFGAKLAEVLTVTIFDTFYRRDGAAAIHNLSGTLCSLTTVCLFCAVPHNDWSGHIGGLATGFFLGIVVFGKYIRKLHLKAAWQLLGLAIFVACLGTAINELVNYVTPSDATGDACTYYKSIFMGQDYNCQCQVGNVYAMGSSNYSGDDAYANVDDMLNDDGDNVDDMLNDDGDAEEGDEDQNEQQQENDENEVGEGEEGRGEERGR